MKLSTIPEISFFKRGLINYRILSTILTLMVGIIVFMGMSSQTANQGIELYKVIGLSILTGILGAIMTVSRYLSLTRYLRDNYVLTCQDAKKNNFMVWEKYFSDWRYLPLGGVVVSLFIIGISNAAHGSALVCVYVFLSPIAATTFRSILLFLSGAPSRCNMYS